MADRYRLFSLVDAPQRSPEWFAARLGRLTGSSAGEMLATIKSGEAAGRANLRMRLILERVTGKLQESGYQSAAMLTGVEREVDAVPAYEALTGEILSTAGFLSHDTLMAGCSPDAYLGDFDVLVSVKCRQPKAHWEHIKTGKVPGDALAQMRHELWITGAREHHYVSWNPDFPARHRLKVVVHKAEAMDVLQYEAKAIAFLEEVDAELASIEGWQAEAAGVSA